MEQAILSLLLEADVTTVTRRVASLAAEEWAPTALGTVRIELDHLTSGQTARQTIYQCPLRLHEEDYSRGTTLSIRYKYALEGIHLQLAKVRLLHSVGQLQIDGWDTRDVTRAIEQDGAVDQRSVTTQLVWAVQVQYLGGRVTQAPAAGSYSTVVLTQRLQRQTHPREA